MPRHVEHNPYAVHPVQSRPGAGAKETATTGRSFASAWVVQLHVQFEGGVVE